MNITGETTHLIELKKQVKDFVTARDWNKYHNPLNLALSISVEAAELLEKFQWKDETAIATMLKEPLEQVALRDELADVMVYCLSLANSLNIDVSQAIIEKLRKNEVKYPVNLVKGEYRKYTELKPQKITKRRTK
ncbi:nucleotide pyrophosphohydrolase [Chloroflexota bacterium]